jgi:hypothetical protein
VHSSGSPAAMNVSLHHTGVTLLHIHERPGGLRGRVGEDGKGVEAGETDVGCAPGGSGSRECRLEPRIFRNARG